MELQKLPQIVAKVKATSKAKSKAKAKAPTSHTQPSFSSDEWLADMCDLESLDRLQNLDWLRDDHPGLDSDGLEDMYQEMTMADAEEFAGENYNSD